MLIAIPSKARAEQANHTYDNLPASLQKDAMFFVPADDVPAYKARFPNVYGLSVDGIGKTRQAILDYCSRRKITKVCMLDDDLRFFDRRVDDPMKFEKADSGSIHKLFKYVDRLLGAYAHVGISAREGANHCTDALMLNTRMLRVLAYRVDMLKNLKIRYDRLPVMEDFDVTLQLLRKGLPNAVINNWVQDQGTSNAPGGCSTYRTKDVQAAGAHGLKKLHSDYVAVVEKETKGAWGGGKRTDVRIAWKKAYASAC
jgi:hypothetical protein